MVRNYASIFSREEEKKHTKIFSYGWKYSLRSNEVNLICYIHQKPHILPHLSFNELNIYVLVAIKLLDQLIRDIMSFYILICYLITIRIPNWNVYPLCENQSCKLILYKRAENKNFNVLLLYNFFSGVCMC